uniref:Putative hAD hydrolase family IA variant 3 n=1 Tax=uncultured bacterium Ad_125_D08 TaxID=1489285 RepID=A0A0B4N0B2_9BACT|nr:putative hAD hydrolase family IA variant 3 [uncultured bacterium Ad_125_D08]
MQNWNFDFDAAIFDMDGTLLDTMPYWRYTSLEYLLAHQWPVAEDVLTRMYSTSSRRLLMEYAARLGRAIDRGEMIAELEGYMNRHYLYDAHCKTPDVPAFLERLKSRGIRMCVATGSPRQFARNGLERLGLLDYFEFVTDNYEGETTKDRPGYFRAVAKRLGVRPERCWVFEDALYAMRSAKADGCRVCAIEEGTQAADREAILELADVYIRAYSELL